MMIKVSPANHEDANNSLALEACAHFGKLVENGVSYTDADGNMEFILADGTVLHMTQVPA